MDEHMMYTTEVEEDKPHHWVMHLDGALNDAGKGENGRSRNNSSVESKLELIN